MILVGIAFAILALVYFLMVRDTPRACAQPDCTTNHWNLGKYCTHHELDQDDERYR